MQKDRGEIYNRNEYFRYIQVGIGLFFAPMMSVSYIWKVCVRLCFAVCASSFALKDHRPRHDLVPPLAQHCLLLFTGLMFCSRLKSFCLYSLKGFPIFTLFCLLGDSLFNPSLYVSKSLSSFQTHFLRRSDRKVDLWGKVNLFVGSHHISCQLLPRKSESISASTTRICCVLLGFAITVAILYTVPFSLSVSFPLYPFVYFWLLGPP